MGYGTLLILTPKIVEEQWVKSDPLNGTNTRRLQNNNNNNKAFYFFVLRIKIYFDALLFISKIL